MKNKNKTLSELLNTYAAECQKNDNSPAGLRRYVRAQNAYRKAEKAINPNYPFPVRGK